MQLSRQSTIVIHRSSIFVLGNIMHTSLKSEHALLIEQIKLGKLRQEVSKGAIQAERGEFSEHTVDTLLKELNHQEK